MKIATTVCLIFVFVASVFAQVAANERQQMIRVDAKIIALTHVRVINGTGGAAQEDQTVVIADGKIKSVAPSASATVPADAKVMDLTGYSVLPGLVGMHDHLFFPEGGTPAIYSDMGISFPRLYLALGVTTIRTAGLKTASGPLEPY